MSELPPCQEIKFLDRNPPTFPENELRLIAADLFGLEGEFKPLISERDQNFRIEARDEQYVLKIANVDEDPDVVDLQVQGLLHVAKVDPEVPVPRVVRTKAGEPCAWVGGPGSAQHIVRVLTYLPGIDLGKMPLTPTLLRNLGGVVARLGKALRGFCHPAARHELLWDLQQTPRMRAYTSTIADKADRERAERVLDGFIADVLPNLAHLRAQIIHHDANGDNVVVSPDAPDQIAGIVDFGDMIHTALAADPAVTAADLLMGGDIVEPTYELLVGYDSVVPLEDEEIDVLYDLLLARCALTVVIIAWRKAAPNGPGYLKSYEPVVHARPRFDP